MKILFPVWAGENNRNNPFFYDKVSGDVSAAKKLAIAFAKEGHSPIYFSLGDRDRDEVVAGVRVVTVSNPHHIEEKIWDQKTMSKYLPLYSNIYANALDDLCDRERVDVILPRPLYPSSTESYMIAKSRGIPIFPTSSGFDYLFFFEHTRDKYNLCFTNSFQHCLKENGGSFSDDFSVFVNRQKSILTDMFRQVQGVVFIAPHMIEHADEVVKNHSPFYVIPDGLDLTSFSFDKKGRDSFYEEYDADKKITITCVARLDEDKRQDLVIEALPVLIQNFPNISLILAGDGNRRDFLEKRVKDIGVDKYVIFLGAVSNEKVPQLLRTSHLAIYPTEGEGLPLFLLEAMAMGIPLVVSNVVPFNYMVGDEVGFLAENTFSSWATQITSALSDIDSLEKKGEISAKKAKAYDIEVVCHRLSEIISQL